MSALLPEFIPPGLAHARRTTASTTAKKLALVSAHQRASDQAAFRRYRSWSIAAANAEAACKGSGASTQHQECSASDAAHRVFDSSGTICEEPGMSEKELCSAQPITICKTTLGNGDGHHVVANGRWTVPSPIPSPIPSPWFSTPDLLALSYVDTDHSQPISACQTVSGNGDSHNLANGDWLAPSPWFSTPDLLTHSIVDTDHSLDQWSGMSMSSYGTSAKSCITL